MNFKNPNLTQQRIVGFSEPIVRTYITEVDEEAKYNAQQLDRAYTPGRKEVIGTRCRIDSAEMSAEFVTPAVLRVPKFHGKPTQLRVNCSSGDLSSNFNVKPTLDGVIVGGASAAGLIAAAVTAGVAAAKDNWSYGADDISVWIPLTGPEE